MLYFGKNVPGFCRPGWMLRSGSDIPGNEIFFSQKPSENVILGYMSAEMPDRASQGPAISFYEKDRFHRPGQFVQRRFRSLPHFFHSLCGLLGHLPGICRVYAGRTVSPRFREMIMLTVASTNDCNA